ncbi:hypothetical protein Tco_0582393, partial [Tanacetum coccineum]
CEDGEGDDGDGEGDDGDGEGDGDDGEGMRTVISTSQH